MIANTPKPPYYIVLFTSQLSGEKQAQYPGVAVSMVELARSQPGFLGLESSRDSEGFGITLSYWDSKESIKNWKMNSEHLIAQKLGKEEFYKYYKTRIALVERDYGME
jgi:heme-degrading monooxygenase HmoA